MKLLIRIILIGTLSPFAAVSQWVEGKVVSQADSAAIEAAHVVNISQKKLAVTDKQGAFRIMALKGDTVLVSHMNYEAFHFVFQRQHPIQVKMKPNAIQLEEVLVTRLPFTAQDFKRRLVDMPIQENEGFLPFGMSPNKRHSKVPPAYDPDRINSIGYAVMKPISFLSKKISKAEKEKVKYYQLKANQGQVIYHQQKFNTSLVKELTSLEGEALTRFIKYLDISEEFIASSTDYELTVFILSKFETFKEENQG